MRTLPRQELRALLRSEINAVDGGADPGGIVQATAGSSAVRSSLGSRLVAPRVCSAPERHLRRPGWIELFFDLVFAAAIAQLSAPLGHDYSVYGIGRFAFLLALVFLAWFADTSFSTQFGVDDIVERVLIVAQIFLVAVMAAKATDALSR